MSTTGTISQEDRAADASVDVYIGRQPVFNARLDVTAYELLFRSGNENRANFVDGERATARVFSNAFMEMGLDLVTSRKPALINMTRDFVIGEFARLFPQERVLLEVLEDVFVDQQLVASIAGLKAEGYKIVLDDFVYREEYRPLVELADIVKIDVLAVGLDGARRQLEIMKDFDVKFLAEKIETHAEFEACREAGFTYFQGYFLGKPQVLRGRRPPADRLALLRLLARINDPRVEIDELDKIISTDVALAYKLLRYINSAFFTRTTKIASIRHALVFLGLRMVRAWVNLVILSGVVDKPHELLVTGMLRAKMAEKLALLMGRRDADSAFTVGLFSILEPLMDQPLEALINELPLEQHLVDALVGRKGDLGQILECTLKFESGEWNGVKCFDLKATDIQECWYGALRWVENLKNGLA